MVRLRLRAEIPSLPMENSQQAVNHTVSGVRVRSKIVPAVTEVRLPHAADGVVHGLLAVLHWQGWDLGPQPQAGPGDRLLPDRLGDAAPVAFGAGAPGPGPALGRGGSRRDLLRR